MPLPRPALVPAAVPALAVVGVLVAGLSGLCAGSPAGAVASTSGTSIVTATGLQVHDGDTIPPAALPLHETSADHELTDVKYVLDGAYLGRVTASSFDVPMSTMSLGDHKLRSTAEFVGGTSSEMTTRFTVAEPGPTPTPTPTPTAAPSSTSPTGAGPTPPATTPPATTPPATTTPASAIPSGPTPSSTTSPARDVTVSDARSLAAALAAARPGETITLADGRYLGSTVKDPTGAEPGRFVAKVSGSPGAPIILRGSRNAVLDGGGPGGGYGLHLTGASYWQLSGFTVSGASKGIVLDRSSHVSIDKVAVTDIGMEGVHFRAFSTDNLLQDSDITDTGVSSPNYGEGVYIGSAQSNWTTYTGGQPDRSDRNQIVANRIAGTGAEDIDVKEGSTGGLIDGNLLDGDAVSGANSADSWIDVKGNDYRISNNHGTHTSVALDPARYKNCDAKSSPAYPAADAAPFCNGFEVHTAVTGWGRGNVFDANTLDVNANTGNRVVGIWLQNTAVGVGNVIRCSNVVRGATAGAFAYNHFTLLPCTP